MRLVRLGQQPSRVAEDIRAALASLGRGGNVIGGIALIGARPFGDDRVIDAAVVLPRGVLVVIGVDLPDPSMLLEAPLHGQWKTDGWPLVHADETVNPATGALALADAVAAYVREAEAGEQVGTVVAVGPFVDTIDQPPADLTGNVRVVYPTPTSMLGATTSLATSPNQRSVRQARNVLRLLAPNMPELADDVLLAEGFSPSPPEVLPVAEESALATFAPTIPAEHPGRATATATMAPAAPPVTAAPAPAPVAPPGPVAPPAAPPVPPQAPQTPVPRQVPMAPPPPIPPPMSHSVPPQAAPPPPRAPVPAPAPAPTAPPTRPRRSPVVRWLPIGAIGLLVVLLVAAVVVASSGGDKSPTAGATAKPAPASSAAPTPSSHPVEGTQFTLQASSADQKCASHGFGDVQASLQRTSCAEVTRGSFAALVDGRPAAATVAVITFTDAKVATDFRAVADTPGGGGIIDVGSETGKWPRGTPQFDGAAYASSLSGNAVRLVEVAWYPGLSTPDDPALVRAAKAALDLQLTA